MAFGFCIFPLHADIADPDAGYVGSALTRMKDSEFLIVEYVAANSAAAEAGIKKGDCIIAINHTSTKGMSPTEARHLLGGEKSATRWS